MASSSKLALGLAVVALLAPVAARADLEATPWTSFLADSTLVLRAVAVRLEGSRGAGSARLRVEEVLRGRLSASSIELAWGGEVHDQPIDRLGGEYLLFLKQEGKRLIPAHYGRGYWLIEQTQDAQRVVRYQYPVDKVLLPRHLLGAASLDSQEARCPVTVVPLLDLLSAIRRQP